MAICSNLIMVSEYCPIPEASTWEMLGEKDGPELTTARVSDQEVIVSCPFIPLLFLPSLMNNKKNSAILKHLHWNLLNIICYT